MSPSETGASEDDSIGAADGEAVVSVVACATSGGDEREVGSVTLERDPRRQQQIVRVSNAASRAGRRVRLRVVADQPPWSGACAKTTRPAGPEPQPPRSCVSARGTLVLESRVTFPRARTCHVGDAPTERALTCRCARRGGRAAPAGAFVVRHPPVREEQRFRKRCSPRRLRPSRARLLDGASPSTTTARSGARRSPPPRASPSRCRGRASRRAETAPPRADALAGRLGPEPAQGRRSRRRHAGDARARDAEMLRDAPRWAGTETACAPLLARRGAAA